MKTKISSITQFTNPWNRAVNPPTTLDISHDDRNLYFHFDAVDDEIVVEEAFPTKRVVDGEDRVELFFSKDKEMNDYIGLEVDAKGRIMAYQCRFYRQFNFDWEPPATVTAVGHIRPDGYAVDITIPKSFLKDFQQPDGSLLMGAYRAEFRKRNGQLIENWLTWQDPKTEEPDFHVPASLGRVEW